MKKKLSIKKLKQKLDTSRELCDQLRTSNQSKMIEVEHLKKQLQSKTDMSMIEQRIKLAYALGNITESLSKAINVVVGKEVM